MKVELSLTQREAEAVLRAELSVGHGVRRSQDLLSAEGKLRDAITKAHRTLVESDRNAEMWAEFPDAPPPEAP